MKVDRLAISIFILGICLIIPLAAVLITIRLAGDVAHSIRLKFALPQQSQEPGPLIEVFPAGDIPQPETSNMAD